jgi:putative redox protein
MSESAAVRARIAGVAYTVTLQDGTHEWLADEPAAIGGADAGPTPTQLLLSSLGACTAITLKMYAQRKQWLLEAVDVALGFERSAEGPRITRRIELRGSLDTAQRERLLQIANACPVHKLLSAPIAIETGLAPAAESAVAMLPASPA